MKKNTFNARKNKYYHFFKIIVTFLNTFIKEYKFGLKNYKKSFDNFIKKNYKEMHELKIKNLIKKFSDDEIKKIIENNKSIILNKFLNLKFNEVFNVNFNEVYIFWILKKKLHVKKSHKKNNNNNIIIIEKYVKKRFKGVFDNKKFPLFNIDDVNNINNKKK